MKRLKSIPSGKARRSRFPFCVKARIAGAPARRCSTAGAACRSAKRAAGPSSGVRIGAAYPEGAEAHLVESGTKDRWAFARDEKHRKIFNRVEVIAKPAVEQKHFGRRVKSTRSVYIYQRDRNKFRGRATAQHWMEKTWDRIASSVETALVANVTTLLTKYLEKPQAA